MSQSLKATPISGSGAEDAGLPKWVWAAVIGGGVAFMALGAYFYLSQPSQGNDKPVRKKKTASVPVNDKDKKLEAVKPVTIEDAPEEQEPTEPIDKAIAHKNKGNKYFRGGRYELAIKCYTEAIEVCPETNATDLATFYQNRAAAYEKLSSFDKVLEDCSSAIKLNSKYVKAMERRAKCYREQGRKQEQLGNNQACIEKLKLALEDITGVCILEGFQKQENIMLVDAILKELGKAEAKQVVATRKPMLTSNHFIQQYMKSFAEDPILKNIDKDSHSESNHVNGDDEISGFLRAQKYLLSEEYDRIIEACDEEIQNSGEYTREARLLRATFYILSKQQNRAFEDLNIVIDDTEASPKLRVNALIKRASLYIQQCKDPIKDPEQSFADFNKAEDIDPDNADVYHHRGQVDLLTDQVDKAIKDFSKSVEINPDFSIAFVQKIYAEYRQASTSMNKSKEDEIIQTFEDALARFPQCVETHSLFAQVLSDQGQFDRAQSLYEKAEKIDPQNANILVHKALIFLQSKNDIDKAIALIKQALERDPKCEFALETLGTIEIQRGNLNEAISLYDRAIPLANTELEMAHLFGLKNAANAQMTAAEKLGINLPMMPTM